MRATTVQLIVSVLFLATACGSLDEHVRRFKEVYVAVVSSVPALAGESTPGLACATIAPTSRSMLDHVQAEGADARPEEVL
jgi:hypothetical protein